jgi:integrase
MTRTGTTVARARATEGPTFGALAHEWWTGVEAGTIGKRKGRKGATYSDTTLAGYSRSLRFTLCPQAFSTPDHPASEHEHELAASLDAEHWQRWIDRMAREGLSRSRIANHLAVVSAVYGWASRATRRLVPANPTLAVELPPTDGKARERVAEPSEATLLLAALRPDDAVPYALAFYTGMRRSEIARLDWADVDLDRLWVTVRQSKSEAGTLRSMPLASPLKPLLLAAQLRQGRPKIGPVCPVSVMSGKLAERARKAWDAAGLDPIGLHECRHTYASLLVAAGYTLKEVMSFMGHADLTTTSRYVKRLSQPNESNAADRLNAYLEESG